MESSITDLIVILIYLVLIIVNVASLWKIFTKAGEAGWAALIPIYNTYVMIKVSDNPWWFLLLMFVPIISLYPALKVPYDIAKQFGKGFGFGLGMIFLPIIFMPILAFGSAQYQGQTGHNNSEGDFKV